MRKENGLTILYLCDFDLSKGAGKDRATRQKLAALQEEVGDLVVISNPFKSPILKIISIFFLDIKGLIYLVSQRPDVFISRGHSGLLSILAARLLSVKIVREIHADSLGELSLLRFTGLKMKLIKLLVMLSHKLDLMADLRIFNHPDLLEGYRNRGQAGGLDFFSYNGFDPDAKSHLSRAKAREKFGFSKDDRIVVFVGTASKWHGVDYLVDLQKEFYDRGEDVKVVFGGGDISEFDKDGMCINFTPLDDQGCADLIRAADFCLLPVKQNRMSPGSPLKLYDYIANERFVFAQARTNGYSDEVMKFNIGVPVDFTRPSVACLTILDSFEQEWPKVYPKCEATWTDRMKVWASGLTSRLR